MTKKHIVGIQPIMGLIATLALLLTACSNENGVDEPTPEEFGAQQFVELPVDLSSLLPEGQTTLSLVYNNSSTVSVKARHYVRNGKSVIDFGRKLRTGEYVLAAASHSRADNAPEETHVGCRMTVQAANNRISPSTFDKALAMFGSGTPDDPYLIASATGLKVMRRLFADGKHPSKGLCFLQIADIDMTRDYNKGFVPIADKSPYPFEGNYDGGGHSISYCAIRTLDGKSESASDVVPATGLFGYVAGATFRNVVMVDPVSIGAGSTGTLIGAVVGISGVDRTATMLRNVRVRRESSGGSEVYGSDFVGGIVGGVDANAVLMMSGCVNENLPIGNGSDGSFAGGLVGGGTVNAVAVLDSCVNYGSVTAAGTRCTGGIIGGIEAAHITNCLNRGDVTARNGVGTGGIAGGLGASSIAASLNEGTVTGKTGTGGLLGSTVIDRQSGYYNDIVITCGHNYGTVRGTDNTGGVVGEAQAMLDNCYNRGTVIGDQYFAGGIIGFAPVGVIHSCYNNGTINARQCAGGIVGRAAYHILTCDGNTGTVTSSQGLAGGIVALGGSTGMVNYCNNFGKIQGAEAAAGIVAKAGSAYSMTKDDVSSLVITSTKTAVKLLISLKQPPSKISQFFAPLKKVKKVVSIFTTTLDVVRAIATPVQYDDMSHWDRLYASELPARNDELISLMHAEISAAMPGSFALGGIATLPELVHRNMISFDRALQDGDDDMMSKAIHDQLAAIDEQVANIEEAREIALAVSSCVLAVAGLVTGIVVPGPGAAGAVLLLTSTVSIVGTTTQRYTNSVEISQCCNFGAIEAGKDGYGIVARLGDYVRLKDCLSAGAASGYGIADRADDVFADNHVQRTISAGTPNQPSFSNGTTSYVYGNFSLVSDDYVIKGTDDSGLAHAAKLSEKKTYEIVPGAPYDFDTNHYWSFQVPAVPIPANNLYFSFR